SATSFQFGKNLPQVGRDFRISDMRIQGSQQQVLENLLPHEITHTILADHFRQPIPRWADEGAAMLAELESEHQKHDAVIRKALQEGKAMRLPHLFQMKEYPQNLAVFYAQSSSITRFLVDRIGREKLLD